MANIIRPFQLSCNPRTLEHNRRFYHTISCTLGFDLLTGEIFLEYDYLFDCLGCMGDIPIPDPGMPKPNGEYLVSGKFFVPYGKKASAGKVKVQLGEKEKELYVFGPRKWNKLGISDPEAVSEIPIDYAHAFGGEGFDDNPNGVGFQTDMLPCVEDPHHLITSKGQTPKAVGLSPLDMMTPARSRFRGNYNNYLQNYFPGYPESTDWRYFLSAPEDQWIKGFFKGNESFRIENMHPEHSVIEGKLPNLKARYFLNHSIGHTLDKETGKMPEPEFIEKKLNLDTVWFFPEALKGMMIWRGVVEVTTDDAKEISHILVAYENQSDKQRDIAYYQKAFQKRLNDPEDRLLNHFKTLDLIPLGATCAIDLITDVAIKNSTNPLAANVSAKVKSIEKNVEEQKQEALKTLDEVKRKTDEIPEVAQKLKGVKDKLLDKNSRESDLDTEALMKKIDQILPGLLTGKLDMKEFSFAKIDEVTALIQEHTDKKKEEIDLLITKKKEEGIEKLEELKKNPDLSAENIAKIDASIKDLKGMEPLPQPLPRITYKELYQPFLIAQDQTRKEIVRLQESVTLSNPHNEIIIRQINSMEEQVASAKEQIDQAILSFKEGYVMSAHFMEKGVSPHLDPIENIADSLLYKIDKGESVAGGDYACIDLSGKNLDGVDLSGSFLEQVNFKGASLKGANLEKCILVRANLENADLSNTNLEKANIGDVQAAGANFSHANLSETILSKGNFAGADFTQCNFNKAEFLYTDFRQANFTRAKLPDQIWLEVNLEEAILHETQLIYNIFAKCNFKKTDFYGGEAISCAFVDSCFDHTRFEKANLGKSCFVGEESSFDQASFKQGQYNQTNFLGMPLQGVDFSESQLKNALFNQADLSESNFTGANARTAQFREAILKNANLDCIQLWEGSLGKADLTGASFVNANLAYTDFLRCTMWKTNFKDANLDYTLIQDWRPA